MPSSPDSSNIRAIKQVSLVIPSKKKSHRKLFRGSHDEVMPHLPPEHLALELPVGTVAA
jgi:hypothetical protein